MQDFYTGQKMSEGCSALATGQARAPIGVGAHVHGPPVPLLYRLLRESRRNLRLGYRAWEPPPVLLAGQRLPAATAKEPTGDP